MSDPRKEHLKVVKWFKGTLSRGMLHRRMSNNRKKLVRCVGVDCARVSDRRFSIGYNSYLFGCSRIWEASQLVVALSIT